MNPHFSLQVPMFILDLLKEPPTNKINSPHRKIIFSKLRLSPCFMAKSLFHSYIPVCHGSTPGFSWLNHVKSIFSSYFQHCPIDFYIVPRPGRPRPVAESRCHCWSSAQGSASTSCASDKKMGFPARSWGIPNPPWMGPCVCF